jgi:hypothetical protein
MRAKPIPASPVVWFLTALTLLSGVAVSGQAADMKFRAYLAWGTDESKPPAGKDYKQLPPEIKSELKKLPLKWTNWFQVNVKDFKVGEGAVKKVPISEKCQLDVGSLGDPNIEVVLIGKGREVMRRKQSLQKAEILVLGGNAPNSTAWLVVLKRLE